MKCSILSGWTALLLAGSVIQLAAGTQLTPLTTFGINGDGTILPGERSYLTGDGSRYQRGMAFNPTTGHLLIVNRFPIGAETINIIDAATGADVGVLNVCCPTFGGSANFLYSLIGVAEDGAIYVGNLTTSASAVTFNLYRWANEGDSQTPVYSGDPRNGNLAAGSTRWGDTMSVRGSGLNTEILIATQAGTLAAILRPFDASMTFFTATTLTTPVPAGGIGYALTFGPGNTFYGKGATAEGSPLHLLGYDLNSGIATNISTYSTTEFPGRVGALGFHPGSNLLAAIEMTAGTAPDLVRLYDVSTPANPPVFLDRKRVDSATNANNIYAGVVAFGWSNVYTLNSDNGIAAFTIADGNDTHEPVIFQNPLSHIVQITSNAVLTVGVDGSAPLAYQWQHGEADLAGETNASLSLLNLQEANAGSYRVVVTNDYGAVTSGVAVVTVLPNFGNLLVYDPFSYPVDTALPGQGGWVLSSASANGVIEAGNLDVPGLAPSLGERYTWTGSSSVRLPIGTYTNGEVYFSFAFRLDDPGTSVNNETFAGLAIGTTTTFSPKINLLGDGTGNYQIGIYKGGGTANGAVAPDIFTSADTVFVVARYKFNPDAGNDDLCDLWVNPDPASFGADEPPAPSVADIGAGVNDMAQVDRFFWRWSSGYPKRTADELRVGFSWAEVTPTLPPMPPVLSVRAEGTNLVISWSTNNAAGYQLQSNTDAADAGGWELADEEAALQGAEYSVTVKPTQTQRYFRLIK